MGQIWQLEEVKDHFGEVVEGAAQQEPQVM
jgi:hypothetical protein